MQDPRILIVDDEPANVQLLERILARANFTSVSRTLDSRAVLERLESFRPDLILLDLHMPHLDGFGVLRQLQSAVPPDSFLPVLVLTADITPEAKLRALSGGATDFLSKPLNSAEVVLRVRNLLRMRELHLQVQRQNARLQGVVEQTLRRLHAAEERLPGIEAAASGVVHDVNNALSIILGFGELLLIESHSNPAWQPMSAHVETILAAAGEAAETIARLRSCCHREAADELQENADAECMDAILRFDPVLPLEHTVTG
jgi:CheY-like chemotaxis protein